MRNSLRTASGILGAALLGALLASRSEFIVLVAIATVATGAGWAVLSLPPVRRRFAWAKTDEDRASTLEAALAGYLSQGNAIAERVGRHPGPPDPVLDELEHEARRWGTDVRDLLQRERPSLTPVFLDDTVFVEYVSQQTQRDTLANWLTRRLTKLGEVIERVAAR